MKINPHNQRLVIDCTTELLIDIFSRIWKVDGNFESIMDFPAIEHINEDDGDILMWYRDGKWHRDGDLPASIKADGTRQWAKYNMLSRDNGLPAVEWADGTVEYWLDGMYSDKPIPCRCRKSKCAHITHKKKKAGKWQKINTSNVLP